MSEEEMSEYFRRLQRNNPDWNNPERADGTNLRPVIDQTAPDITSMERLLPGEQIRQGGVVLEVEQDGQVFFTSQSRYVPFEIGIEENPYRSEITGLYPAGTEVYRTENGVIIDPPETAADPGNRYIEIQFGDQFGYLLRDTPYYELSEEEKSRIDNPVIIDHVVVETNRIDSPIPTPSSVDPSSRGR